MDIFLFNASYSPVVFCLKTQQLSPIITYFETFLIKVSDVLNVRFIKSYIRLNKSLNSQTTLKQFESLKTQPWGKHAP